MLEDSTMDRKASAKCTAAPPAKPLSQDTKTQTDGANRALRNGSGRKREPSLPCSNSTRRKQPLPNKTKFADKKPPPRNQAKNGKSQMTLGLEPEVGSVIRQGSKKQNVEQLINFHHEPRAGTLYSANNWRVHPSGPRGTRSFHHRYPKYNKEQFLQASYQFVVKSENKYSTRVCDADLLVDWDLVEEIRVASNQVPSCPICLYSPRAAKMTRCGHIYCWPCILHYLALSDKTWRKCPICYEAVHLGDLKSVMTRPCKEFEVGSHITMQLMKRERDSTIALPVSEGSQLHTDQPLSMDDSYNKTDFAKLLTATPEQVRDMILRREKGELERQLMEDRDEPEACFIEQALQQLADREERTKPSPEALAVVESSSSPCNQDLDVPAVTREGFEAVEYIDAFNEASLSAVAEDSDVLKELPGRERCVSGGCDSVCTEGEDEEEETEVTVEDLDISSVDTVAPTSANRKLPKNTFYFYQASDGQQVYLHALNVHMLAEQYGGLENCPRLFTAKVLELNLVTMTNELRRRWRYLQHLPLCSQLQMVELDVQPPLIGVQIWTLFQDQVRARRRSRQKKAKADQKRAKPQQTTNTTCSIKSAYHFPQVASQHCPVPGSSEPSTSSSVDCLSDLLNGPALDTSDTVSTAGSSVSSDGKGMSFAQMLRDGQVKAGTGAWGGGAIKKSSTFPTLETSKSGDVEDEDYSPPPGYKESFRDGFSALTLVMPSPDAVSGDQSSKKKKKGKQKQLLFSNSMTFSG